MAETAFSQDVRSFLAALDATGNAQIANMARAHVAVVYPAGDLGASGDTPNAINRAKNRGVVLLRRFENGLSAIGRRPNNPGAALTGDLIADVNAMQQKLQADPQGYFTAIPGSGGIAGISWPLLIAGGAAFYLFGTKRGRKWLR